MPFDNKYGRVSIEFGDIPEDEPVVIFRARDVNLPKLLMYYHLFCVKVGSPRQHLDLIMDSLEKIQTWQSENSHLVKIPRSNGFKVR